ncbi:hypothetical protein KGA66_12390 [Actinocrinis puniceicyclus]|uniref:DUF2231 domain-containing protein n=1 Tax=Actinocrinis puniceicyclus TaxID=977794 RepID=A0A8J8BEK6_9ACTN|nr:DUF2231 domain-containing protein [Actinocrinis puniceicyclus]MBS2963849.1 hypothetical protein [Actinocrinis puniceicyclus]
MPVKVFGLPTHILLLHVAVAGVPLVCLTTIAVAARPKWRARFGIANAVFAMVMVGVTYATQVAGQQLYNHAPYLQKLAAQHRGLGLTLVWFVAAVAVFAIALVVVSRAGYAEHHAATVTVAALAIAASAICVVQCIRVGDSGARAVWGNINVSGSARLGADPVGAGAGVPAALNVL